MAKHDPRGTSSATVRRSESGEQSGPDGTSPAVAAIGSPFSLLREGNPTAIAVLLFALIVLTFLPCLRYGFVNFDDNVYVYENAHVRQGLNIDNLRWAFTTLDAGFWHPLTWLSLLLDDQLFGLRPGGYHLTNLLLHAANTVLVFVLLHRLTGTTWRSALVAALFGLHPLHVEPVAWVADRKDLLCALFWMLALLMYVRYAEVQSLKSRVSSLPSQVSRPPSTDDAPHATLHGSRFTLQASRFYLLSLSFFAMGLMSKTMVVTLPFILLLLDWWPLRRLSLETQGSRLKAVGALCLEKLPFLAAAFACGLVTLRAEKGVGALPTDSGLTIIERLANAVLSYVRYLGQTVWPASLAIYYPYPAALPFWPVVGAGLALLSLTVLALWAGRRQPYLAFGWTWYVVTLLPVIGLIQVGSHSHADRYVYVPLIGVFMGLIWGAFDLARRWVGKGAFGTVVAVMVIGLCAALARNQLSYWQDSEILLRHTIAVTGDNEPMRNNLGTVLVGQGRLDEAIAQFREAMRLNPESAGVQDNLGAALARQGKLDEASRHLREAIRLDPDCADAHNNLGAVLGRRGRLEEAIGHLRTAIKLTPYDADPHCNLADALTSTGRLEEAIREYQEALKLKPDDAEALCNLGVALGRTGRLDEAIVHFQEAVQANPKLASAQNGLASALLKAGRVDEAIVHYQKALAADPSLAPAQSDLASALLGRGRAAEAISHYQAAIDAQPGNAYLLNNLAWVLATSPETSVRNGPKAVELGQKAERLSGGKNPSILGTLAAAYAETRRFPEAVTTAQRALALAMTQTNTAQIASLQAQLAAYRAGSPFRDVSQTNAMPHLP